MLVNELRTALEQYENAVLKEIIVSLYKMIPKSKKEDQGLDDLLLNFSKEKEKQKKGKTPVNFKELADEIVQFIDYANASFYYAPNRIVSKEKRSKWRFEVKRFIKELIPIVGESSVASARLLAYIYEMLSYGCNYYIFSTENPFSAVGYEQPELLRMVLSKIFYNGYDEKSIKTAVFLTLDSNTDRETLHLSLLYALVGYLKTPDTIEMALGQCVAFKNNYDVFQAEKPLFKYTKYDGYRREEHRDYAAELYLMLKFKLHEYDEGIRYFWDNYSRNRLETTLYVLLQYLDDDDMNNYWIREYEKALKKKIKPRDELAEEYEERKRKATMQGV